MSTAPQAGCRARGQFADQAQNALFKLAWLERVKERAIRKPMEDSGAKQLVAGVDVGGGQAETVVGVGRHCGEV
jgi:hypothetical protein